MSIATTFQQAVRTNRFLNALIVRRLRLKKMKFSGWMNAKVVLTEPYEGTGALAFHTRDIDLWPNTRFPGLWFKCSLP